MMDLSVNIPPRMPWTLDGDSLDCFEPAETGLRTDGSRPLAEGVGRASMAVKHQNGKNFRRTTQAVRGYCRRCS